MPKYKKKLPEGLVDTRPTEWTTLPNSVPVPKAKEPPNMTDEAEVTIIHPGTPEWEESERALQQQRRRGL